MGFRISARHVNQLANLLAGRIGSELNQQDMGDLREFADALRYGAVASNPEEQETLSRQVELLGDAARVGDWKRYANAAKSVAAWLDGPQWIGAIITGMGEPADIRNELTSYEFLRRTVRAARAEHGRWVLLQFSEPIEREFALENVFPAFKIALNSRHRWPGLLAWSAGKSSGEFFPLPTKSRDEMSDSLNWLVQRIIEAHASPSAKGPLPGLWSRVRAEYARGWSDAAGPSKSHVRLLHLSDVHCGSDEAMERGSGLCQVVKKLLKDQPGRGQLIPVITGDLVETPSERMIGHAELLLDNLSNICGRNPLVVPGNHDLRTGGIGLDDHRFAALYDNSTVRTVADGRVQLICMNSCQAGGLAARGNVGEHQLRRLGKQLDEESKSGDSPVRVALLHHHLRPVERPNWYRRTFLEWLFGRTEERSMEMGDAGLVTKWLKEVGVHLALHGHRHIPHASVHEGLRVIGCGSSVGKVKMALPNQTYLSLNLVTIDLAKRRIYCDLMAERTPGTGPKTEQSFSYSLEQEI